MVTYVVTEQKKSHKENVLHLVALTSKPKEKPYANTLGRILMSKGGGYVNQQTNINAFVARGSF